MSAALAAAITELPLGWKLSLDFVPGGESRAVVSNGCGLWSDRAGPDAAGAVRQAIADVRGAERGIMAPAGGRAFA